MRTTYATKSYIKALGGITRCYPMGKGQGLFQTKIQTAARAKAIADGWKFIQLGGVGHDYNFDGDIFKVYRED